MFGIYSDRRAVKRAGDQPAAVGDVEKDSRVVRKVWFAVLTEEDPRSVVPGIVRKTVEIRKASDQELASDRVFLPVDLTGRT